MRRTMGFSEIPMSSVIMALKSLTSVRHAQRDDNLMTTKKSATSVPVDHFLRVRFASTNLFIWDNEQFEALN